MEKRYIKINLCAEMQEEGCLVKGDVETKDVSDRERIMLIAKIFNIMMCSSACSEEFLIDELLKYISHHDELSSDIE